MSMPMSRSSNLFMAPSYAQRVQSALILKSLQSNFDTFDTASSARDGKVGWDDLMAIRKDTNNNRYSQQIVAVATALTENNGAEFRRLAGDDSILGRQEIERELKIDSSLEDRYAGALNTLKKDFQLFDTADSDNDGKVGWYDLMKVRENKDGKYSKDAVEAATTLTDGNGALFKRLAGDDNILGRQEVDRELQLSQSTQFIDFSQWFNPSPPQPVPRPEREGEISI